MVKISCARLLVSRAQRRIRPRRGRARRRGGGFDLGESHLRNYLNSGSAWVAIFQGCNSDFRGFARIGQGRAMDAPCLHVNVWLFIRRVRRRVTGDWITLFETFEDPQQLIGSRIPNADVKLADNGKPAPVRMPGDRIFMVAKVWLGMTAVKLRLQCEGFSVKHADSTEARVAIGRNLRPVRRPANGDNIPLVVPVIFKGEGYCLERKHAPLWRRRRQ